jgi:hypothetical protein
MKQTSSPNEINRVRKNTCPETLAEIDEQTRQNIEFYSAQSPETISRRIAELEREWSIERWIETNASTVGFSTALLALVINRKWGLLTCAALGCFLLHGLQGFDPLLPMLRKKGIRTRGEIDHELYALKVLRGDLPKNLGSPDPGLQERAAKLANAAQSV